MKGVIKNKTICQTQQHIINSDSFHDRRQLLQQPTHLTFSCSESIHEEGEGHTTP